MKKISLLLMIYLSLMAWTCDYDYNELGDKTYFYYRDGRPVYPVSDMDTYPTLYKESDQTIILLPDKNNDIKLIYRLSNFNGPGRYTLNPSDSTVQVQLSMRTYTYDTVYPGAFIDVLEWNPDSRFFSAVFEATGEDIATGSKMKITKGRINLVLKPYQPSGCLKPDSQN